MKVEIPPCAMGFCCESIVLSCVCMADRPPTNTLSSSAHPTLPLLSSGALRSRRYHLCGSQTCRPRDVLFVVHLRSVLTLPLRSRWYFGCDITVSFSDTIKFRTRIRASTSHAPQIRRVERIRARIASIHEILVCEAGLTCRIVVSSSKAACTKVVLF